MPWVNVFVPIIPREGKENDLLDLLSVIKRVSRDREKLIPVLQEAVVSVSEVERASERVDISFTPYFGNFVRAEVRMNEGPKRTKEVQDKVAANVSRVLAKYYDGQGNQRVTTLVHPFSKEEQGRFTWRDGHSQL